MRPEGSASELELRRKEAVRMIRSGQRTIDVAAHFGVSRIAVYKWKRKAEEEGLRGLKAVPQHVPQSRLTSEQKQKLKKILLQGAAAWGFASELWTCERLAQVIEREFGISYHPGHLSRILKSLGYSCQKPAARARERDERAAEEFRRRTWPAVKKGRRAQC